MLSIISHLHNANTLDCCSVDCHAVLRAEQFSPGGGKGYEQMVVVMRGWQWYNSSFYTQREYDPFHVEISFEAPHVFSLHSFHYPFSYVSGLLKHASLQGHSSYVHTKRSFAFSHPSARGADVGSSSWAPHPWLDLAQPAGGEATWHPGWPGKQASPVARRCPGLSLRLQLGAATCDVYFNPATKYKQSHC